MFVHLKFSCSSSELCIEYWSTEVDTGHAHTTLCINVFVCLCVIFLLCYIFMVIIICWLLLNLNEYWPCSTCYPLQYTICICLFANCQPFRYASPHLWNQLPSSFRQPHCVHSPGSPNPAHITSSQSPPSLLPSITPLAFHSRLKTHLFHKLIAFLF